MIETEAKLKTEVKLKTVVKLKEGQPRRKSIIVRKLRKHIDLFDIQEMIRK